MQPPSGWTSVNKVRENTAVFTAERRDAGSNINAAARHVNTELIITPGVAASMHRRSSADARHERSDTAVSQDAERSWLWVRGDITWKLHMNLERRKQTCLCAVPQGLSDMETWSQFKQSRQINRDRRSFWGLLVAQQPCCSPWVKLNSPTLRSIQWDEHSTYWESLKTEWSSPTAPRHLLSFTAFDFV